ncbi:MAG: hypothetical protein LUD52_03865 [Opitutae bacterium]|nr:hypothetical protein [Opitutae bacterium]
MASTLPPPPPAARPATPARPTLQRPTPRPPVRPGAPVTSAATVDPNAGKVGTVAAAVDVIAFIASIAGLVAMSMEFLANSYK